MSVSDSRVTYRMVIFGRVQGVSFRVTLKERALRHRINGWVKNRKDGAVEALIHGREDQVREIIRWAKSGPPGAVVKRVSLERVRGSPPQIGFLIID